MALLIADNDSSTKVPNSCTTSTLVLSPSDSHLPSSHSLLGMETTDKGDVTVKSIKKCDIKVYKIRWVILLLFVCYSMSNAFQWIQYSIITNIIVKYYEVDSVWVDWCSMVYMVAYIPLIFPASWYLEKKGLRKSVIIGSCGTMIGAWVKCGSIDPDRFWVSFCGQIITAVSQIFILGIPPRLAAVWFSNNQVSTACAIGVFGNQLGVAMGFLLPPVLVPDDEDKLLIAHGLTTMFFGVAAICTTLFLVILFVFKEAPPTPPSFAEQSAQKEEGSYVEGILRLINNKNYLLLLISYGMNVGVFYGISTLLNQTVLEYFNENQAKSAGQIGLLIVISGMVGSVVSGVVLDKTAKFKLVTAAIYGSSFTFMIVYTFIFEAKQLSLIYVVASGLGFFMTGYLPVGFEFAAELTFPEPEGTSSGLLNASAQFFGIICTLAGSQLMNTNLAFKDKAVNLVFSGVLLLGTILTILIKEDLRRQSAQNEAKYIQEPIDSQITQKI